MSQVDLKEKFLVSMANVTNKYARVGIPAMASAPLGYVGLGVAVGAIASVVTSEVMFRVAERKISSIDPKYMESLKLASIFAPVFAGAAVGVPTTIAMNEATHQEQIAFAKSASNSNHVENVIQSIKQKTGVVLEMPQMS